MRVIDISLIFMLVLQGAHALTLFVQTPTSAGSAAMVVWTRDATDGAGELRFDLRFVSTGNATTIVTPTATSASSSSATTPTPSPSPATDSSADPAPTGEDTSFVVQPRADGGSSSAGAGTDAGLALANIRLLQGASAGSADVFFPRGGQYVLTAVSGPNNTPIGTSNSVTVNEPNTPVSGTAASATPTTAPALTTTTPTSASSSTPSSSDHIGPVSAASVPAKKHANLPAIIGGILGALVGLTLIATLAFLYMRKKAVKEKRRLTFHREWMVQSSESVRNLRNGGSQNPSEDGHGVSRTPSAGPSRNPSATARPHKNTTGLLVPPSPFICVTPPPDDLETGLAKDTIATRANGTPRKLRLHMYTNDTDPVSPTASTSVNVTMPNDTTMPLPAGAAPPTMYTPTMLANARNVASAMTPMRQTSTVPISMPQPQTALARMSTIHSGATPMGPRAPSPAPAAKATNVTPTSPFPPQLPPLNLNVDEADSERKPPASAPARSMTHPVKTVTVHTETVSRAATIAGKGKVINTLATRPASPRLPPSASVSASASASTSTPAAAPTPTTASPAKKKTPRQHLLAARLAILQNQMAELLSAPDSVHSSMVLADMRRQVAWILEHENGDWALGRSDEKPAGWARVMTP